MNPSRESESLRPVLRQVEAELEDKIEEVCDTDQRNPETTGELIRLEEALSDAAKAAKQAVSLRRRLREDGNQGAERGGVAEADAEEVAPPPADASKGAPAPRPDSGESGSVRQLTDRQGRAWRIWAVLPETMKRFTGVETLMGEYRLGWLAFESVDGELRKRLTNYPDDWQSLPAPELEALLERAESATRRKPGSPKRADDPHP
jgi:hypothetical protein